MKSTIKWIVFVPVCLVSVLLMLLVGLSSGGSAVAGITMNTAAEIVIYSFLCMYLLFVVLSFFDKQTARMHLLLKNPFCGVTSMLSAFLLAAGSALEITSMAAKSAFSVMGIATSLLTLLSAVALLFVSMNHFSGTNTTRNISILYLSLPLWCGIHLISRFLTHTADPVSAADTLDLVMYVALALFFMYSMMIHALIPGRNAVKSAISVGFPTVTICFAYATSELIKVLSASSKTITTFIPVLSAFMLGLYVLGFTVELSLRSKTKDELIIDDEAQVDESEEEEKVQEEELEPASEAEVYEEAETEEVIEYFENVSQDLSSADSSDNENSYSDFFNEDVSADDVKAQIIRDTDDDLRSEDTVIVEGEKTIPAAQKAPLEKSMRGATVKESILIDDEFILDIDSSDNRPERPTYDKDEDISSFILDKNQEVKAPEVSENKEYESRMDEIDKLIISIQGGENSEDK